ncbi:AraC family transcriptional regulator [Micrococcaceae bacterium Sec5.7]
MDKSNDWSLFSTPNPLLAQSAIVCLGAGEQASAGPSPRDRKLPSYALVYISSGDGWYTQGDPHKKKRTVRAPALISIPPGVEHRYGPDEDGWSEHWVLFNGAGVQPYRELGLLDPDVPVVSLRARADGITELFAGLRTALSGIGLRWSIEASVATQRLLLEMLSSSPAVDAPVSREMQVLSGLKSDVTRPISMADRARLVGVSLPELRAIIRSSTGLNPLSYIVEARISHAQVLLAETGLTVGTIAGRIGYDDPAYFARLFTQRVGVPPTVFRQQQSRVPDPVPDALPAGR